MKALDSLHCFQYHKPGYRLLKSEGWQFSPMQIIYDLKQQDLRHKSRLVMGGHVVDEYAHTTSASTVAVSTVAVGCAAGRAIPSCAANSFILADLILGDI